MVRVGRFKGECGFYVSLAAGVLQAVLGLCVIRFSGQLPMLVGVLVVASAFLLRSDLRRIGAISIVVLTFGWWFYFLGSGSIPNFRAMVLYTPLSPLSLMGYAGLATGIAGSVLGFLGK